MNSARARASSVLPTPVGTEEDERADRPVRVLQARARAPERVRDGLDGRVLPDHAPVQTLLHVDQLLGLALEQPGDGDPRPRADDRGDVVLVDLLLHHRLGRCLPLCELLLELGQLAVADLGDALEIAGTFGALGLHPQLVDAGRDLADPVERTLLLRPTGSQAGVPLPRVGELPLDRLTHVGGLLAHRRELDLELADGPIGLVQLERRAVDLHLQAGRGLVDEVDRLVGQLPVGDVAVGEHRGGDECGVSDADAVMRLVLLLQAAQDRDRVGHRGLADEDRLKAALERGVLLDVLAVLVECRRADRAQLPASKHRLQQVGRVDGALGRAGADDGVQLVDEEDDLALGVRDLREDGLQPLLELAPVLRAREQRADVERPDPLALEAFGHVAGDDPLCEALGDCGLADARLADQDRVVLRPAREHLDDAADLLVASDHRIELPGLGGLGQVAAELRERLVGPLRILRRDALTAADVPDAREQRLARDDVEREQQVLRRDVVVLELARLVGRAIEDAGERRTYLRLLCATLDRRLRAQRRLGLAPAGRRRRGRAAQAAPGRAARPADAPGRARGSRRAAPAPGRPRSPPAT